MSPTQGRRPGVGRRESGRNLLSGQRHKLPGCGSDGRHPTSLVGGSTIPNRSRWLGFRELVRHPQGVDRGVGRIWCEARGTDLLSREERIPCHCEERSDAAIPYEGAQPGGGLLRRSAPRNDSRHPAGHCWVRPTTPPLCWPPRRPARRRSASPRAAPASSISRNRWANSDGSGSV